jgi:hypothetical protein
MLGELKES